MIADLVAPLISISSTVIAVVLIVVLGVQEVYGHIKVVRSLLIEYLIAFIGIDLILSVRRTLPLNEATTIIAFRLVYSLMLFSTAVMGYVATIIYRKPKSPA